MNMEMLWGIALLAFPIVAQARDWTDIVSPMVLNPLDSQGLAYILQTDPLNSGDLLPSQAHLPTSGSYTAPPTPSPTTFEPRKDLSESPTKRPTKRPTLPPTEMPTSHHTVKATSPPTQAPDPYPDNPPPSNPPSTYFNYNTSKASPYGPGELALLQMDGTFRVGVKNNNWGSVSNPSDFYWEEFTDNGWGPWKGVLANRNVQKNMCETGQMQSPIDVKSNGAICEEHHEVRSLPGDYRVTNEKVKKEIHPNKLRLLYPRRPCADLNNVRCQEPDPPYADFPNGWGGFADVLHVDFKVPSEHRIQTETFDAEMQIYHLHPGRRRLPTLAVTIRAEKGGYNFYFQEAIKAFQYEYEKNRGMCAIRQRKRRELLREVHSVLGNNLKHENVDIDALADYSTDLDRPDWEEHSEKMERLLQSTSWDPHHPLLVPTIHFYRYDGSLTEPPCGEWVSWFVADSPMIISFGQLEQLKNILFNNYDENCRKTSVHYGQSVARPIRPTGRRPVWQCKPSNFGPDP